MKTEFKKRLFVGIPAGLEIQSLTEIQSSIKHNSVQIKWIPSKNIHMTVSFLGNVTLDNIPKLTQTLEDISYLSHFRVSIEKTGVFPSTQFPKIFWLGVSKGRKKMIALHKQIEKVVIPFKASRKRDPFIPHITIGRATRSYLKIDVLPFLKYVYSPREFDINSVVLYESRQLPHGVDYQVLTKFLLN